MGLPELARFRATLHRHPGEQSARRESIASLARLGKKNDPAAAIELPAVGDGFDGAGRAGGAALEAGDGLVVRRTAGPRTAARETAD